MDERPPPWARTQTVTSADSTAAEEDSAAIIRRAAAMGIPAWRVKAALGLSLPQG